MISREQQIACVHIEITPYEKGGMKLGREKQGQYKPSPLEKSFRHTLMRRLNLLPINRQCREPIWACWV
jgi:hypothetical protein